MRDGGIGRGGMLTRAKHTKKVGLFELVTVLKIYARNFDTYRCFSYTIL